MATDKLDRYRQHRVKPMAWVQEKSNGLGFFAKFVAITTESRAARAFFGATGITRGPLPVIYEKHSANHFSLYNYQL